MEENQTLTNENSSGPPAPVFLDTSAVTDPPKMTEKLTPGPVQSDMPASAAFKLFCKSVITHYFAHKYVLTVLCIVGAVGILGYTVGHRSGQSLVTHESAPEGIAAKLLAAGALVKVVDDNGKEIKVVKASDATQIVKITNLSFGVGSDTSALSELPQLYALRTLGISSVPIGQSELEEYIDKAPSALSALQLSDLKEIHIDVELMQRIVLHFPALKTFYAKGIAITDEIFPALAQALQLGSLNVAETEVSDEGIAALAGLKLSSLDVSKTNITVKGLLQLKPFIKSLGIGSLQFSDDQLAEIAAYFVNLQSLDITNNMSITDASIPHLAKLTGLTSLNAKGTQISEEGVKQLLLSLPACKVQR